MARKLETIGERLDRYNGIGPGFDFLRVALALSIVFFHCFAFMYGEYSAPVKTRFLQTVIFIAVPMFFALSGFLISGSAQRLKLKDFLLNRGLRIAPALAVDILISALILGPLCTTYALGDYLKDEKFSHYFLNLVGYIHYELPGVFENNPVPDKVNGALWTVPYEIGCYILMSGCIFFSLIKSRRKATIAITGFIAAFIFFYTYFATHPAFFVADTPLHKYLMSFMAAGSNFLYLYFLLGVLIFIWRHTIPHSGIGACIAFAIICLISCDFVPWGPATPVLAACAIGYFTVYIGLLPIKNIPLYSRGDYSYGIYLYGWPIQQAIILGLHDKISLPGYVLLSFISVTAVAMLSWHLVEKPLLGLRKKFSFTARKGDAHVELPANNS